MISVSSVFVNVDPWILALLDISNDELLCYFTIFVFDREVGAIVQESVRAETERLAENKANPVLSADFINCCDS